MKDKKKFVNHKLKEQNNLNKNLKENAAMIIIGGGVIVISEIMATAKTGITGTTGITGITRMIGMIGLIETTTTGMIRIMTQMATQNDQKKICHRHRPETSGG